MLKNKSFYGTKVVIEMTKKRLKDAVLKRNEEIKNNPHVSVYADLEEDYYEALFRELEILALFKESIHNREKHKRVLSEPIGEEFMNISCTIKGKYNIKKFEDWLNNDK